MNTLNELKDILSQEYVNGQLKNKYGDAFIRGNNGVQCLCHLLLE